MVAHIVSDGRLFGLKPFDWVMLLVWHDFVRSVNVVFLIGHFG